MCLSIFFFKDTPTTEIYTYSPPPTLHGALRISSSPRPRGAKAAARAAPCSTGRAGRSQNRRCPNPVGRGGAWLGVHSWEGALTGTGTHAHPFIEIGRAHV